MDKIWPAVIHVVFMVAWAYVLKFSILLFICMLLPFMAVDLPVLVLGWPPPWNYHLIPFREMRKAPLIMVMLGGVLSGGAIFFTVSAVAISLQEFVIALASLFVGFVIIVISHEIRMKQKLRIPL